MVKYPSSAVEQTRESIHSFNNPLETILLLTCLVKNGMREDRKKALIGECITCSSMTEEEIIELYTLLDIKSIYGISMNKDQKRLGYEPSGNYRHEEYLTAKAIENIFDIRLYRSEDPRYDFIWRDQKWDLVGPVAPFYFDANSFVESLYSHLYNKKDMQTLVTCTLTLPFDEQESIRGLIETEQRRENLDILLLDSKTFEEKDVSFSDFSFLCSNC